MSPPKNKIKMHKGSYVYTPRHISHRQSEYTRVSVDIRSVFVTEINDYRPRDQKSY